MTCLRLAFRVDRGGRAERGIAFRRGVKHFRMPRSSFPSPLQAVAVAWPIHCRVALFPPQRIRAGGALAKAVDDFVAPVCTGRGPFAPKAPTVRERYAFAFSNVSRCRQTQNSQSILSLTVSHRTIRVARVVHYLHAAQQRFSCVLWGTVDDKFAMVMYSKINTVIGGPVLRRDKGPRVVADFGIHRDVFHCCVPPSTSRALSF